MINRINKYVKTVLILKPHKEMQLSGRPRLKGDKHTKVVATQRVGKL
jgi:hypothetical protein